MLNNATFFFPAGEITFLVGKSGSGKSTLGNLLLKYYVPHSGEIIIDGQPIQTLNTDWVRQNVMLVQQHSVLFNETILQNIAFGSREDATRNDIRLATRTACLEKTIDEMPKGFYTLVGSKNRALSGGQSQRVAIARARLRDAPILILDESTSALDQASRMEVMNRIREWRRGKTTIIITHDISQILDNDYVYVLQNAKVVQEGYRRNLAEKAHGSFVQFLRGGAEDVPSSSHLAANIGPRSTGFSHTVQSPQENTQHLDQISGIFSTHDMPLHNGGKSLYPPGTRLSLAAGMVSVAQANALREDVYWSSPIIPDSPVESKPQRFSVALMSFISPKASLQIPSPAFQSPMKADRLQETPFLENHFSLQGSSLPIIDESTKELEDYLNARGENHPAIELQDSLNQNPASLATIFRSVLPALAWRERLFLVLGLFASVVVGAATPAFSWTFSQLLQTFYITENQTKLARKWALCMLAIAAIDAGAWYCSHYFLEHSGQAWINSLRVESLRRILVQPKSWFDQEQNSPSRLTDCLDRQAEEMRNLLGRFVGLIITILTMLVIAIIWAFVVDWKLTLVALASAPVMYAVTRLFHWSSAKWDGKSDRACEVTSSIFFETFSNIRVVRALTLESYFDRKHRKAITEGYKIGKIRAAVSGCMFGLTDSLIYYIVALAYYYGAHLISSGEATVTRIFIVANLLLLGTGNAIGMFAMIPQLSSSRTTAKQVLRLANLPLNDTHESEGSRRLADPFPIKCNNLCFTYPSRPHVKSLDSINLTIDPSSCTAIVGPSGSGKSTIASLLLGLYPPNPLPGLFSSPTLTFAGKSILEIGRASCRERV